MKKTLSIFIFLTCFTSSRGQNECQLHSAHFLKAEYEQFVKDSCNFKGFKDSKAAKRDFSKAKYYYSFKEYHASTIFAKDAYVKSSTPKFRFQILKIMVANYKGLGDKKMEEDYQKKVDAVISTHPEVLK